MAPDAGPRLDYKNPNFPTEHLLKDIDLVLRSAAGRVETGVLEAARELYRRALENHRFEDYSCVFEALLKRSRCREER